MTLAKTLMKLWGLRIWVALGILLAAVIAVGSVATSHSTVYSIASTQMLVDSPSSGLASAGTGSAGTGGAGIGSAETDITDFAAQANVFARLMTSSEALQYIGKAAGIPGNRIDANGPVETDGSPAASHAPTQIIGGKDVPFPPIYKLSLVQNPSLPTVDIYAQAPSTAQAIALANGAVSGFAKFIEQLNSGRVSPQQRIDIRQLGSATGGTVANARTKTGVLIFFGVLVAWCGLILFISSLRAQVRAAKENGGDDRIALHSGRLPHTAAMSTPSSFADHTSRLVAPSDARLNSLDETTFRERFGRVNGHGTAPAVAERSLVETPPKMRTLRNRLQHPIRDTQRPTEPRGAPYEGEVSDELGPRP